jgi:type II secretory pathway component PulK
VIRFLRPPHDSNKVMQPPKGIALVSVMALVAVVATLSVSLAWLGYQAIARTQAQRDVGQAKELAKAVIDYGRWVLWSDARGSAGGSSVMDHLAEPWAQFIPHSRLDQLLGTQMNSQDQSRFSSAAISGLISDEQSRFNLARVIKEDGSVIPDGLAQIERLFVLLGIRSDLSSALVGKFQDLAKQDYEEALLVKASGRSHWSRMQEIVRSDGSFTQDQKRRLLDHITWLPKASRLNINTVTPEVLRALAGDGQGSLIDDLIARRDRIPFRTPAEAASLVPPNSRFDPSILDTQTHYFRMQGYAQFGLAEESFLVIVHRTGGKVSVVDRLDP